jgi:hypothetical protein
MKISIFILIFTCICTYAQVTNNYRIIGTNLFDFSNAGIGTNHSIYFLGGETMRIVKTFPKSVQIEIKYLPQQIPEYMEEQSRLLRAQTLSGGPEQTLLTVAAFRTAFDDNGNLRKLSQGELMAMSPEFRSAVLGAQAFGIEQLNEKRRNTITTIYLLNPPNSGLECYAVPTEKAGFWDCGVAFTGDLSECKYIYRVLPDRIVRERNYSVSELEMIGKERANKIISWQLEQASNNLPSYQFEVGMRYINGDGLQTNVNLGSYWVGLAASNKYPAAIKYISEHEN